MFDSTTFTQDMLSNPTRLMKTVIDAMEKSDATGQTLITDPNNGFVMQMSASLAVLAKLSEKIDNTISFVYPQRSRNAEQLYPHLSEFDFVKLMASPATLPFVFAMDADWIREKGVYYDSNYNKLEIPGTSYIDLNGIIYSMYYPIEILINRNTGAISAFYDTSVVNSLHALASNMLLDVQEYTKDGVNWFQIAFNMYQFERKITPYTVSPEEGFVKTLTFEDQFYAAKIYTINNAGIATELEYSLSKLYYNFKKPTAVLDILNDTSQVKITIPQIYFDNGQISKTIRVKLYTTKGAINYTLSPSDLNERRANFDTQSSVYAAPFEQMPVYQIFPTQIEVAGGTDVLSYNEVRDAIVNQDISRRVAVTSSEITRAGKRAGFNLTRVKDDLTERIYFASNILTDNTDMIIPTFTGGILLKDDALHGNPSTIINHTDGYYTILPTTTFKVSSNGNTCTPMSDGDITAMAGMTKQEMVTELNTGSYVRQPFHITLKTDPKSPQALIYNLLSPKLLSLSFIAENSHSAPQMSVTACNLVHMVSGTGGYRIIMELTRSENIEDADLGNFVVALSCLNKGGEFVYLPAGYTGKTDRGLDQWEVQINTNYHISSDDYLTVEMYNSDDVLQDMEISIDQLFSVTTGFIRTFDPDVPIDTSLNSYLPQIARDDVVAMARQTMKLEFGRNLSAQIYCAVNTSWGNDVYKTAGETVYYQNTIPVFQLTEDGVINTRVNTSTRKVETVEIYPTNSTPSTMQDLVVKTTAGVAPSPGGTTSFVISNTQGLLVGMKCRGLNVPAGAKITDISAYTVTVNKKISKVVPQGTDLTFTNPQPVLRTSAAQASAGNTLKVPSTADLIVGQSVFGFDIPAGTKVQSVVDTTTFTISVPTTKAVAANTLLTIINTSAPGVIKIAPGDIITDASGKALIVKSAQNQYLIPSILFDGRLFASEDPIDQQVVTTIAGRLSNYATQITSIDEGLIEDSDVYYRPARSMGYAEFGIGGGDKLTMSLELGFTVFIYVDAAVYNTQTLLSTMEKTVVGIINEEIQKPTISISTITKTISDRLGTNAAAVEMGPISGRDGLRLVSINQPGIIPSIENKLTIEADGHIKRSPNIVVKYLPKPDTAESEARTSL